MRLRLAAFALAAASCGLAAPARADDTTAATATTDVVKYLPAGSGYYVHVNVRQFLAAPVVRKAIPMAVDKYSSNIMDLVQFAKAFDPNAAAVPNEQIKTVIDELKKPETIAKAFDAAKDGLTDMIVAGVPGSEEKMIVIFKCHEAVNGQILKQILPAIQGMPQIPVQIKAHEKDGATVYELQAPQQPQAVFFTVPKAGVVCLGPSRDLIEQAAKGGKGSLTADLTKLVAERKGNDFVFFAMAGKLGDAEAPKSGWGRVVLAKDISGEMSATFDSAEKATEHAKEANEKLKQFGETIKGFLGAQGKDVAPALDKMKAVATGSTVSAKGTIPGEVVEKLLTKDKE